MPYSLERVEFWRIWRKIVYFDIFAMCSKPLPHISIFVIGCVVLNQIYLLREITTYDPFEIDQVRESIEDCLKLVKKSSTIQFDGAINLECVSLSC